MTAVEYILNLVVGTDEQGKDVRVKDTISKSEIAKAKAMEKEQIMNAWNNGQSDGATICTQKADNPSKQYYNETFKSE